MYSYQQFDNEYTWESVRKTLYFLICFRLIIILKNFFCSLNVRRFREFLVSDNHT